MFIYAMCNQLNQFNNTDPRFAETCMSLLLGIPFTFKYMPDENSLKLSADHINARLGYVIILVSLLYSTRQSLTLCQSCLRFVAMLMRLELVKVDYLISRSGLLQVLFNLLRFFSEKMDKEQIQSENVAKETEDQFTIMNDMKQVFGLITRLLIGRSESADNVDNYTAYLNTIVSLCYDSTNIGYERFNNQLKAIVLDSVQTVMSDLNSISAQASMKTGYAIKY